MDMDLDAKQDVLRRDVESVLRRHAGPVRARQVATESGCDLVLLSALRDVGALDLPARPGRGRLDASLVVEWAAETAAAAPIGSRALVGPAVADIELPLATIVCDRRTPGPVRFAAGAEAFIVIDGDEAELLTQEEVALTPVATLFGYSMANVRLARGRPLARGAGEVARRWWRVALAAETAGTAAGALTVATSHVQRREQFGRPLAAFQAIQHRLVECHALTESLRWQTRQAAAGGATSGAAAAAALTATETARRVLRETHQVVGAVGLLRGFDLHVWSLRLQTLRLEAGGVAAHADALVEAQSRSHGREGT